MRNLNTDHLIQLYESGERLRDIAAMFDVDRGTIATRLKRAGINLRADHARRVSESFARRREQRHTAMLKRYSFGATTRQLSNETGIDQDTIARQLRSLGVDVKSRQYADRIPVSNRLQLPDSEITKLFQDGMSVKALSDKCGCSRSAIKKRLEDSGIQTRPLSESQPLYMQSLTKKQRQQITKAAHAAVKGRCYSFEELCKRASEREISFDFTKMNRRELLFYSLAASAGLELIPQKAAGPYNADFAVHGLSVTVEIYSHSSSGHRTVPKKRKRLKYFLDRGYAVITILNAAKLGISPTCIQKVLSLTKQICRNESMLSQEYVILGDGNPTARRRTNRVNLS